MAAIKLGKKPVCPSKKFKHFFYGPRTWITCLHVKQIGLILCGSVHNKIRPFLMMNYERRINTQPTTAPPSSNVNKDGCIIPSGMAKSQAHNRVPPSPASMSTMSMAPLCQRFSSRRHQKTNAPKPSCSPPYIALNSIEPLGSVTPK